MSETAHVLAGPHPAAQSASRDKDWFAAGVIELIASRYGYSPPAAAMPQALALISTRRAGLSSEEYWRRLHASPAGGDALQQLVEDLLNHETECGRTPPHFEALRTKVLPDLALADRPLRLASLGCSTGEEAYSLALAAVEVFGGSPRVEVVGLDLSRRALAVARAGSYPATSLRELSPAQRERGFTRDGSRFQVRPEVARLVRFNQHNLLAPLPLASLDLVFCRNVLIYFAPHAAARVLGHIRDALGKDGLLFLGHAESAQHQRAWFSPVRFTDTLAYRRR